jgi:hypothetical protein
MEGMHARSSKKVQTAGERIQELEEQEKGIIELTAAAGRP